MEITNEMVVQAAQAVYRSQGYEVPWEELSVGTRAVYQRAARAALQAVRGMLPPAGASLASASVPLPGTEITEDMVERGARAICELSLSYKFTDDEWAAIKKYRVLSMVPKAFRAARRCLQAAWGGDASDDNP